MEGKEKETERKRKAREQQSAEKMLRREEEQRGLEALSMMRTKKMIR